MPTLAERLETATSTLEGLVANTTGTGDMVLKNGAVITPASVNGNTISTGTGTLTLGSFTLVIGGNITFSNPGRILAATVNASPANGDIPYFSSGSAASTFSSNAYFRDAASTMTAVGFALVTTASVISPTYGGTGVNNDLYTLTLGGNVSFGATGRNLAATATIAAANAALREEFTEYVFGAADMSAATPSGAGYTGLDSVRNEATTYTTTAGVGNAHASFGAFGLRGLVFGGFAISAVPFAKRIEFSGTSAFITGYLGDANSVSRVYIGGRTAAGTGTITSRAIGWKKAGGSANIFLSVHNGTTETTVDTGFAPTTDTAFSWRITSDGAGNVVMFINGTQVATTSAGPSTTGTGGTPPFQSVEGVAGNATRQAIICTAYRIRIYA